MAHTWPVETLQNESRRAHDKVAAQRDKLKQFNARVRAFGNKLNNSVSVAFMHSDVLAFRSKNTDMTHFKTLLALFSEDVHFVALAQPKSNGWSFSKPAPYNTIEDLKGKKVGAAGGGVITANVIRNSLLSAGATTYTVQEYPSGGDALNALANGDVDAVEFTGAAPLPNLVKLNSDYKLLSIPDNVAHELSDIYHPTTVTYVNMRPDAVQTIAADCIVVARDYKSPRLWKPLKQFRDLFYADLTDIQETPGNHTKWSEVKADNHGKWPWLVFPGEPPVNDDAPAPGGSQ